MIGKALAGLGVVDRQSTHMIVDRSSFQGGYPFDVEDGTEVILQTLLGSQVQIAPNFVGLVQKAYRHSPIIYALVANRALLFSEVRFQWAERRHGLIADIFGDPGLSLIEHPWPNGSTRDLLKIAEIQNACAGNFFGARRGDRIRVMRPDWTEILIGVDGDGDPNDPLQACRLDAEVLAYAYWEGGPGGRRDPVVLEPHQVIHYKPMPDPIAWWRGASWLAPVIEELCADQEMTAHKRKYMQGGATPNVAMSLDPEKLNIRTPDEFEEWVTKFEEMRRSKGGGNPYKMMFVASGADPKVLGANLDQIDFSKVQSAGEVRMAAAAQVHPSIVAIEAGLEGSALNAGNFEAAFRQLANGTMRPLWGAMANALEPVLDRPTDDKGRPRLSLELTYDDREVPALQEDAKKRAETFRQDVESAARLWDAGWEPDSIVAAVNAKDMTLLVHTGLDPVQAQPANESASQNGSGKPEQVPAP